mgnify:CR=1 FL=1
MSDFMISNDLFFFFAEQTILFLFAGKYNLYRTDQILLGNQTSAISDGCQRSLIYDICKIRTNRT